ncbi:uncharacterized protein K441DRAFT_554082, partial [Cenococcum geophilum 1.58]|uniref:uncharacterized protein n=1 Tax=Cenococcum geophilum 1.58 TaxID=794803 RepID=UPI00358EE819
TYLTCLYRIPKLILPYGHLFCKTYIRIFREESLDNRWIYYMRSYFLYSVEIKDIKFKIKPDIASVVVFSIDGGGI